MSVTRMRLRAFCAYAIGPLVFMVGWVLGFLESHFDRNSAPGAIASNLFLPITFALSMFGYSLLKKGLQSQ
jgi:hypothetical protein